MISASGGSVSSARLAIGYSSTVDHLFQFYGLSEGLVDTEGIEFVPQIEPMATLNARAQREELAITALSAPAFAQAGGHYALLSCGARFGAGYGPLVVTRNPLSPVDLHHLRIAVADPMSSGFAALSLFLTDGFDYVVMSISEMMSAAERGEIDAALIEDEGQLTHQGRGLYNILDLGAWWQEQTGLDLPLDFICVHTELPPTLRTRIRRAIRASVDYGLDNSIDGLDYVQGRVADIDADTTSTYVSMYVTESTRDMGQAGQRALQAFLDRCAQHKLISTSMDITIEHG